MAEPEVVTVGMRVAQIRRMVSVREWRDVKQAELASVVGRKQSAWSSWETGDSPPDYAALAALGVSANWVMRGLGDPFLEVISVPEAPKPGVVPPGAKGKKPRVDVGVPLPSEKQGGRKGRGGGAA